MTEPILIVGTGALGCLFAARLAAAGHSVGMLGTWPKGLAVLREHGVTLQEPDGSSSSYPVQASARPGDFAESRLAFVLVKSWQTARAAEQLAACLDTQGVALTLQNGLGNREILAEALGEERVAFGVTTGGATLLGPGRVQAGGEGKLSLGHHPHIAPLRDALAEAGFEVEMVEDVDALAWSKLVVNAAINPLTALLDIPNGELLERPAARELSAALARETAAVAEARGLKLSFEDPVAAAEDVARRTAGNHSSMLQDVRRGAPTEINAICGAVVQTGRQLGVSTPVNEVIWNLIKARANRK